MDTIYALATASGKAGVSIIRISGSEALDACAKLGGDLGPHDRRVVNLTDRDGSLIDKAFALSFEEGRSFTGEPVVELHTHGSPAIVSAVLRNLQSLGLRHAEPGEFTNRALDNGMLDLAQVEGLADLIDAETESQRRQAVRVFDGALGELVENWRRDLVRAAALLEATIDFVDEDVPVDVYPEVLALTEGVLSGVSAEAKSVHISERIRDGFEVALIGSPNSGKSTLLNRLAGRDAAITSDIAGTTRDIIEVKMDLEGFPVTFLDTAGIRESEDVLEEMGIARGIQRAKMSDVRVHLLMDDEEAQDFEAAGLDIHLIGKSDTREPIESGGISGKTGEGVQGLIQQIVGHIKGLASGAGIATRSRHEVALVQAADLLLRVQDRLEESGYPVDLLAEDLRSAIRSLDVLVGRIDVENVLGEIFSSFCIGK